MDMFHADQGGVKNFIEYLQKMKLFAVWYIYYSTQVSTFLSIKISDITLGLPDTEWCHLNSESLCFSKSIFARVDTA